MKKVVFFSPSTCGAYTLDVHGTDIPDDAIEISQSDWASLLEQLGNSAKKIAAGADGYPVLVDPPPLSDEQLEANERAWRDAQLSPTDAIVSRHRDEQESGGATSLTPAQYTALQVYRRQLREWPQGDDFPLADHRPAAPAWLTDQLQ
ncbi:hypothetical protein [Pseudomonas sp. LF090]